MDSVLSNGTKNGTNFEYFIFFQIFKNSLLKIAYYHKKKLYSYSESTSGDMFRNKRFN